MRLINDRLVKVRLQTRAADGPKTMSAMFGHIFKEHGVHGLYKGVRNTHQPFECPG